MAVGQNYTALLQEFRRQLNVLSQSTGKQYVLTADSPAGSQNYVNIDLPKVAKVVDYFTVQGYNYAGSWDTVTNHASPSSTPGKTRTTGRDSTSKTLSLLI